MRFPLRLKLVLALCVPLLAIYVPTLVHDHWRNRQSAVDNIKEYLTELTSHRAADLERDLTSISAAAEALAAFVQQFPPHDEASINRLLTTCVRNNPYVCGACLELEPGEFRPGAPRMAPFVYRGADEKLQYSDLNKSTFDPMRKDWYLLVRLLKRSVWTDPYHSEVADVTMCTYSVPLLRDGKMFGVVALDISLDYFCRRFANVAVKGGGDLIVTNSNGWIVSHPDSKKILAESLFSMAEQWQNPEVANVGRRILGGEKGVARVMELSTGEPYWWVFKPLKSCGWAVIAVVQEKEVMSDARQWLNARMLRLLVSLGVVVVLVWAVSNWTTRPLQQLMVSARAVAGGNLDAEVTGIHSRDEIGQFARTFNEMLRDLKASLQAKQQEITARLAMERELQLARQIQISLLPPPLKDPFPRHKEFRLHAQNEPASYVAGDFFDYWMLDEATLALVIADVSGKGIPAAIFMAVCRTVLRTLAIADRSPAETLAMANRLLTENNQEQYFVTLFYAQYRSQSGDILYANAGHNPPYVMREGRKIESLGSPTGPAMGVWEEEAEYCDRRTQLHPGDVLILYTDGVTEAIDSSERMLSEEGLERLLRESSGQTPDELCHTVVRRVQEHCGGSPQDDVTIMVLQRTSSGQIAEGVAC